MDNINKQCGYFTRHLWSPGHLSLLPYSLFLVPGYLFHLNLSCRFTLHFVNALPSAWNCHSALLSKQIQTLRANINVFSVLIWHLWMSTLCHCSSTKVNWEIKRKIIQFGLLRGYGLWWWGGVWTNNYQGLQRREYGAQKAWNIGVESWRGAKEVRGQLVRWEAQSCVPSHIM